MGDLFSLKAVQHENCKNDENRFTMDWSGSFKRRDWTSKCKAHLGCPLSFRIKTVPCYGCCVQVQGQGQGWVYSVIVRICIWRTKKLSYSQKGKEEAELQVREESWELECFQKKDTCKGLTIFPLGLRELSHLSSNFKFSPSVF